MLDSVPRATRELIDTPHFENTLLRDQLAIRTEEIRRCDHIIGGFIARLPELSASTDTAFVPQDANPAPLPLCEAMMRSGPRRRAEQTDNAQRTGWPVIVWRWAGGAGGDG